MNDNKIQSENYCYYEDGRHGWVKVPKKDLVSLGIADKISEFSFMNGEYAYLEEDCDAGILLDAFKERGVKMFCDYNSDYSIVGAPPCPIWDYDRYFHDA